MLLDAKSGHRARLIGIADIIAVLYFHILNIARVYSRPHTPKDNPVNERFNRTIQEEWLEDSDIDVSSIKDTNKSLTQWLIEYNTYRPHESLDQLTPLEYVEANLKVLPMSPACTYFDVKAFLLYKRIVNCR